MAKAHTLIDNFNDNVTDSAKWIISLDPLTGPERIREVNGRVEIRFPGHSPQSVSYRSLASYDLTGSQMHVELINPARVAGDAEAFMTAGVDSTNRISISVERGRVSCWQQVAGTSTLVASVPYDPKEHRWLRLRERSGITYWEVSGDCQAWMTLFSKPNPVVLTVVTLRFGADVNDLVSSPGIVIFDNFNVVDTSRSRRVEERRLSAREVRDEAAELAAERPHLEHANNNDEVNYPSTPLVGNYSKSLKHDSLGDPDPTSYGTLVRALQSRDPADFEEVQLASNTAIRLTNPQSGLAFDVEGPDAQEVTMPPAPRFDSEQTAHEIGELYWMSLARDVAFVNWSSEAATAGTVIKRAIDSLNDELPAYGGARPVTVQTLFRGIYPGEQIGPYVSQFLLKGNTDQRKPDGLGRDANEGYISYGARVIDQRIIPAATGIDYLKVSTSWLDAQNGVDTRGQDTFDTTRRFIRNLRDGATSVHFDQVLDAFYNAAWILMSEPTGNQLNFQSGVTGRPQIDLEFPNDQGNPYNPPGTTMDSRTQAGFATFGPIHLLQVLGEVLGRALRAVWWQKWGVHRRLRPEEFGGRVHNHITAARAYPIHTSILTSLQTGLLSNYFGPTRYFLPQAYPEGAPTHPAFGAGHATGSGACATILKAFFDETKAIENPLQAAADGLSLIAYTGTDAAQMTVGGELNKLAGNIALFRNAAGVHWRTDYTDSLPFGEAVAVRMLQEMSLTFNEDDAFFELTRFDGQKIRIFDGKVVNIE